MNWSDLTASAKIQRVRDVYRAGMSAFQIGKAIGEPSRNAIIGLYKRNPGLRADCPLQPIEVKHETTRAPAKRLNQVVYSPVRRVPLPNPTPMPAHAPEPLMVPLMELGARQCKWPMNDGGPFLFCGNPSGDKVYCRHHMRLAIGRGTESERTATKGIRE